MRILAVDDDEMILEILKASLVASGYHAIETAMSAPEAMAKIEASAEPYDCLLLDIQMPGMDGIELCSWVKRRRGYASTPVIMVTAMSERSFIQRAFAAGATDYVTKPFDPLELGTRVGLAHRLVEEGARTREKALEARLLRDQMEQDFRVAWSDPVTVFGVAGAIGQVNLENYLLQMSRSGLFSTTVLAVRVDGLEAYHRALTPSDFYFLLADVAEALSTALRGREFFLSYAGSGAFVVVIHGPGVISTEELEFAAGGALELMGATEGFGALAELRYRCGDPHRIGVMRSGTSAVRTMHAALAQLDRNPADRSGVVEVASRAPSMGLTGLLRKLG